MSTSTLASVLSTNQWTGPDCSATAASARRRKFQQRADEQQDGENGHGGGQRVHLAPCAGGVRQRGAAGAVAHREPAQEARAEVGGAQGQQLLIGVQAPALVVGGEGTRGEDDIRVAHEEETERRNHQPRQLVDVRQGRVGQPRRHVSDHGDAVLVQAERRHCSGSERDHDQRPGHRARSTVDSSKTAPCLLSAGQGRPRLYTGTHRTMFVRNIAPVGLDSFPPGVSLSSGACWGERPGPRGDSC
ncbi:hypothetical protein SNARM312S_03274 [Streptomyces narbonensis]